MHILAAKEIANKCRQIQQAGNAHPENLFSAEIMADCILEFEQQLSAMTKDRDEWKESCEEEVVNKKQFERDWLQACYALEQSEKLLSEARSQAVPKSFIPVET